MAATVLAKVRIARRIEHESLFMAEFLMVLLMDQWGRDFDESIQLSLGVFLSIAVIVL